MDHCHLELAAATRPPTQRSRNPIASALVIWRVSAPFPLATQTSLKLFESNQRAAVAGDLETTSVIVH